MSISNIFEKIGEFLTHVWDYFLNGLRTLWEWGKAVTEALWAGLKKIVTRIKKVIYVAFEHKWILYVALIIVASLLLILCTRAAGYPPASDFGARRVKRDIGSTTSSAAEIEDELAELGGTIGALEGRSERIAKAIENAQLRVSTAARAIDSLEGLTHETYELLKLSSRLNEDARIVLQGLRERYTDGDQEIDEE